MPFDRIHYSALAWPILANRASAGQTITYGELAQPLGIYWRQCNLFLEEIQDFCLENQLPPLTALVVGKVSGVPSSGFIAWDIGDAATAQAAVYNFDWKQVRNPFDFANKGETEESLARRLLKPQPEWQIVYRMVESRGLRQAIFRRALLEVYNRKCAFSDCRSPDLLQAAHILPWNVSTPEERMDVRNGLLLSSIHHHLFDLDWLRITPEFKIVKGPELPDPLSFGIFETRIVDCALHKKLKLPSDPRFYPNPEYIKRRYAP